MIKKCEIYKNDIDISKEWDIIASNRTKCRIAEKDKSFTYILLPKIEERVKALAEKQQNLVVDIGCGCGELSNKISKWCKQVIGIDISRESISIARKCANENVEFIHATVEAYAEEHSEIADICVLNMLLSNVYDCKKMCSDVKRLLKKKGRVLVTVPHPCYWPDYWKYNKEEWYDYKSQVCMEADFIISGNGNMGTATHIHRPIEMYMNTLIECGYRICNIEELFSEFSKGQGDYPYPRFLYIECETE